MKAAGLSERKNALDPAVAFFAFGSLASLAPEHRESNHALAKIIGWPHSLFRQEKKQAVHFVFHSADIRPRFGCQLFYGSHGGDCRQ